MTTTMETTAPRVNGTPQRHGHLPVVTMPAAVPAASTPGRRARKAADRAEAERIRRESRREADQRAAEAKVERKERRSEILDAVRDNWLIVPLVLVNSAAMFGQVPYFFEHATQREWLWGARAVIASGVAGAIESIALYVQFHAHDALMIKATATAAKLRRYSYLIGAGIGAINYSHFSGDGFRPNGIAITFGLLSSVSPWLWGLYSRWKKNLQLRAEGNADSTGAEFSIERWRAFPIRTWLARRWSIDYGVSDPITAWEGYRQHRAANRQTTTRQIATAGTANDGRQVPVTTPPTTIVVTPSNRRGRTRQTWPAKLRHRTVKPASVTAVNQPTLTGPAAPSNQPAETVKPAPAAPSMAARQPVKRHRQTSPGGTVRKTAKQQLKGAAAVLAAHAENPSATNLEIARISGASIRTVERHRPAKTTATKGA